MSHRGVVIRVGCLLLLLTVGCHTGPPLVPPGLGRPLALDDLRAEQVLDRHLSLAAARPALRGLARVVLEGPDFKLNRPQRIAIARPDRLRFEVLGLFDQLAGLLVVDGRDYGFFDASSGEIVRGPVTPTLLWELTGIHLAPDEAGALLLGVPTPSSGTARAGVWLQPDGRIAIAFAWPEPGATRPPACSVASDRSLFDPACFLGPSAIDAGAEVFIFDESDRLRELRVLESDALIRFRAVFEDYAPLAATEVEDESLATPGEFAKTITIRSPGIESEARFVWKRVMLARSLSDRLFEIPTLDGRERGG